MNVYDSNRINDLFTVQGYSSTNKIEEADVVVLNTCHIREKAAEKVYSDIGRINKLKKDIPKENFKLVVAGCVAQQEGEALLRRAPELDLVMEPQHTNRLETLLTKVETGLALLI